MFSWTFIFRFIVWLQIWRLAAYAGVVGNPLILVAASAAAYGLLVWPFPLNKPHTNNGGHE